MKKAILILATIFSLGFTAAPAFADSISQIQGGVDSAAQASGTQSNDPNTIVHTIINLLSILVGIVAVIMIIVGGFRYITSGGDSGKVGSAKNTILYALIGLVIVALAQTIAIFVLDKATNADAGSGSPSSSITQGAANSPH